jgi:hypothetical protein
MCLIVTLIVVVGAACKPVLNKRFSLWRNDRIPYGTYQAFNSLEYIFTNATIESFRFSPELLNVSRENNASPKAYIVISQRVLPSEGELNAILSHAASGNFVFISSVEPGDNLLDSLHLKISPWDRGLYSDSLSLSLIHPLTEDSVAYSYPGISMDRHFTNMDSGVTNILGKNKDGAANFVSLRYDGGGAIFLHLAPAAFTNFFLLHKDNKSYYDLAMSQFPDSVRSVKWDDYFRTHENGKGDEEKQGFDKLRIFLSNPVLRWAFWLTLILIAVVYLFESKRRQRIIPVVKPLKNASMDFVETIGRLYFQQKDNRNLFDKIRTQFTGHVRHRYQLTPNVTDAEMENKLAFRSGYDAEEIKEIFDLLRALDEKSSITDDELLAFNDKIDKFYKKA